MREIILYCEKIANKETQIIIVTHSPYFLNFIPMRNILVCRKDEKYTKTFPLAGFSKEIATRIEGDIFLNRQKTEILFARGVILVEGPYDRRVFTVIDSKEKTHIFENGISLIDVGGMNSFGIYIELCIKSEIPWVTIGDKNAFYLEAEGKKGPLSETLKVYVGDQAMNNLTDKIKNNKTCNRDIKAINTQLKSKKGAVVNLSGNDISDTIIEILKKKEDDSLYKALYVQYGGSQNETDMLKIRRKVIDTIKKGKDEMAQAFLVINKPNELEKKLKQAMHRLIF